MSAAPQQPRSFAGYDLHEVAVADLVSSTCRASPVSDEGARGEDVALRVVHQRLIRHRRAVDGFLHVNNRVAAIDHPHMLRLTDVGADGGVPYAASVWRDGIPLSALLLESAPLDTRDVLRLGGQLAEALDTVHGRGIVHGTVGLPSVWIKRRRASRVPPSAALTAFGTSHLLAPILDTIEDDEASVELLFIAPEQLHGEPAGPAADQYALACVLFTALTGTTPFRGDSNNELFGAHLFTEPPDATAVRDGLDPAWNDVFGRALAKDPAERFENCRTLLLAAGRCAHGAGGRPRPAATSPRPQAAGKVPVTPVASTDDVASSWWRRRLLRIVLTVALLVMLAVLAMLFTGAEVAGAAVAVTWRPAALTPRDAPRSARRRRGRRRT
ncbi:MAG: serine/threonine protein kinase [Actinobacteria bacterium]|nr:serine/threonine protein kinase [Actinomycetota bacterium]